MYQSCIFASSIFDFPDKIQLKFIQWFTADFIQAKLSKMQLINNLNLLNSAQCDWKMDIVFIIYRLILFIYYILINPTFLFYHAVNILINIHTTHGLPLYLVFIHF